MSKTTAFVILIVILFACKSGNYKNKTVGKKQIKLSFTEASDNKIPQKNSPFKQVKDIPPPANCERVAAASGSFGSYLRNLKLKQENNQVYLYNGELKGNQSAQFAVIKMDVGKRDLQQCADAVMRLRAEFLFQNKRYKEIHFKFTSGHVADYQQYAAGYRPSVHGSKVSWHKTKKPDSSYKAFRNYMNLVFNYAGSYSLSKELQRVSNIEKIKIGDVFIQGGFPGHAVIVIDVAENTTNGERFFMLAQSYMPAQEIHILKNPEATQNTPWYTCNFLGSLYTPEYIFEKKDLKRFK